MVELLIQSDKEVPYGVIDEPLAAGFELLRQDIATTRSLKEFNTRTQQHLSRRPGRARRTPPTAWSSTPIPCRGRCASSTSSRPCTAGRFTWMPTVAQGMYHPQYFGRNAIQTIEVKE